MFSTLRWFNLALRGLMELGIVLAFGYWGFHFSEGRGIHWLLAIGAPLAGFGFWSLVDFHRAGRMAEYLRLSQELLISGLAAVALYISGQHAFGWILGSVSMIHHILVYLLGGRLLKQSA